MVEARVFQITRDYNKPDATWWFRHVMSVFPDSPSLSSSTLPQSHVVGALRSPGLVLRLGGRVRHDNLV